MSYTISKTANTMRVIAGDTSSIICGENGNRYEMYITVTGGNAWIKLVDDPDDDERSGMLIKNTAPFPFAMMPDFVYYGEVYCINEVAGESPVITLVEIVRDPPPGG